MGTSVLIQNTLLSSNCRVGNPYTGYKIFIWVLTFIVYTAYHMSRKPISVIKGVLNCNVSLNSCHSWEPFGGENGDSLLGVLDSCFLFAYAGGMFVSGHIAERVNLRYFLSAGMLGCGVFVSLFGLAQYWNIHHMAYFVFVQLFAGLFESTGWPTVVACVANWFGKGKRGIVMGIWNAHTSVGNILGGIIPGLFADSQHWGLAFIIPGVVIGFLGIVVFFILIPYPEDVGLESPNATQKTLEVNVTVNDKRRQAKTQASDAEEGQPLMSDDTDSGSSTQGSVIDLAKINTVSQEPISIRKAVMIPGVIEFAMCLFFAKLVSYTFLFWLPFYIKKTTTFTNEQSADLATAFDVGGIIGSIAAGGIADVTRGPGTVCGVMLAFAAPAMFVYNQYGNTGYALNIELLILTGILVNGPYGLITTAVSADLGTHDSLRGNAKALATVTAIIDGTGSIGAAIGPLITGIITNKHGWESVFFMLIAADIIALLMLSRVIYKEIRRWCRPQVMRRDLEEVSS